MMDSVAAINDLGNYAYNPRGNLWFNDESSYGRKLLLKMGWNKGKGLGRNEDGIKENLKVKFKDTNSGLGYENDSHSNVMSTEYESILKSLSDKYPQQKIINKSNGGCVEDGSINIRQKSRAGKNIIRYPKLYYGKDVSKYSEKDMKSIFIYSLPMKEKEEEKLKDYDSSCNGETEKKLQNVCETYNSNTSISDYFYRKMKEKKENELRKKLKDDLMLEKPNSECNKADDAAMVPPRKRCKKRKRNPEIFVNGDNSDILSMEGKEKLVHISDQNKRTELSGNLLSEEHCSSGKKQKMSESTEMQSSVPCKKRKKSHRKENLLSNNDAFPLYHCDLHSDTLHIPKKKKKSHRKDRGSVDPVELLSVSSEKNGTFANNELLNIDSTSYSMKDVEENLSNNIDHSTENDKNLKNKFQPLKKLKSCLKSKKKYSVKNVSFSENIFYRMIEPNYESTDSIQDATDELENDLTSVLSENNDQNKDSLGYSTEVQDSSLSEQNGNKDMCSDVPEMASEVEEYDVRSLPSSKSSHFNSWVDSQRLALKMKIYKQMLKCIKKHEILKTTNLLSIKGYGNWGFK